MRRIATAIGCVAIFLAAGAQLANAQLANAQSANAQSANAQSANAQSANAQSANAQSADAPSLDAALRQADHDGPVTWTVSLDRDSAQIAEPIQLSVEVSAPTGTMVTFPDSFAWDDWTVLDHDTVEQIPSEDGTSWLWNLFVRLESMEPGDRTIPIIPIDYRLPGQSEIKKIVTEPLTIEIVSVLQADDQPTEPRAIKGPTELSRREVRVWNQWWIGLGIAGIALLSIACWWWFPQASQQDTVALALAQVDAIQAALDRREIPIAEAYGHLSSTLRGTIELQWGVPATSSSSDELIAMLRNRTDDVSAIDSLGSFLHTADRVRFAGESVSQSSGSACEEARRLIGVLSDLSNMETNRPPVEELEQ